MGILEKLQQINGQRGNTILKSFGYESDYFEKGNQFNHKYITKEGNHYVYEEVKKEKGVKAENKWDKNIFEKEGYKIIHGLSNEKPFFKIIHPNGKITLKSDRGETKEEIFNLVKKKENREEKEKKPVKQEIPELKYSEIQSN